MKQEAKQYLVSALTAAEIDCAMRDILDFVDRLSGCQGYHMSERAGIYDGRTLTSCGPLPAICGRGSSGGSVPVYPKFAHLCSQSGGPLILSSTILLD